MPAGDYYLNKFNGSSIDEKVFLAQANKALGFDWGLHPVMLSVVNATAMYANYIPKYDGANLVNSWMRQSALGISIGLDDDTVVPFQVNAGSSYVITKFSSFEDQSTVFRSMYFIYDYYGGEMALIGEVPNYERNLLCLHPDGSIGIGYNALRVFEDSNSVGIGFGGGESTEAPLHIKTTETTMALFETTALSTLGSKMYFAADYYGGEVGILVTSNSYMRSLVCLHPDGAIGLGYTAFKVFEPTPAAALNIAPGNLPEAQFQINELNTSSTTTSLLIYGGFEDEYGFALNIKTWLGYDAVRVNLRGDTAGIDFGYNSRYLITTVDIWGTLTVSGQIVSTIVGAPPFVVNNSNLVIGLNANYLEGYAAANFSSVGHTHSTYVPYSGATQSVNLGGYGIITPTITGGITQASLLTYIASTYSNMSGSNPAHIFKGGNSGTTGLLTINNNGQTGFGTSPNSTITIKAGTAAAGTAPLKFIAGVNLTTVEAGAFEFDGTNLYFTPGTLRKTIAFTSDIPAAHNPVTIGTANGLSLSTQALSMAAASTSVTGALTSTDWNTFNNKVSFPGFGTNHTTAAYGDHTHSTYIDFVSTQVDILGTKVFGSSAMGGLSHNSVIGTKGTTLRGLKVASFNENLLGHIDIRAGYSISAPNTTTFTGNVNSLFDGNTGSGIQILTSVINDTTPFILEVTGPNGFMSYMYFGSFFNFIESEGFTATFQNGNSAFTSWKLEIKSAQDGLWYTLIDRTGVVDKVNNLTLSGFTGTSAFFLAGGRTGSGFRLTVRAGNPYVAITYPQIYLSGLSYYCDGAVTESGNLVSQRGGSIYGNLGIGGSLQVNAMSKATTDLVTNLNADLLDGNHASAFATASHTHSNYDNYNQWTFQPETFAGSGASYTINSGYFVKLKAGTGMDLSHSIVGSTVTVTLTSSGGFPGFGTTHATAAYGDHTHSNYDNYNQWTLRAYNGAYVSKSVISGQEITLNAGSNVEWDTADFAADGILVMNVINIPNIVLTGYTAGSTGLVAATDSLKVALSKLQTQMPKTLYYDIADYVNVGSSATDLENYTLHANTLSSDGQRLELQYSGSSAANTTSKTIQFYFGGTSYIVITNSNASSLNWFLRITIIRYSSTYFRLSFDGNWNVAGSGNVIGSGINYAATNVIKLTAQAGASNEIICKLATIAHFSS